MSSATQHIDAMIASIAGWRGRTLSSMRELIHTADPAISEEMKWRGVPVFSYAGILCTLETYKTHVKLTFAKGASLPDPAGLFNSSLAGKVRRAIDIREGETLDGAAFTALIQAAVATNVKSQPRRAPGESTTP